MNEYGSRGLSFLDGSEVAITSGWLSLSEQLKSLREYNERLEKSNLTRLPSSVFDGIRRSDLEQAVDDLQYSSIVVELFNPSATAVASWGPLVNSCVSEEPGVPFDLLPPIREWTAGAQPASALSIVELAFYDVSGLTVKEIDEKVEPSHPVTMTGHEIALAVYSQGINFRGFLRDNGYRIIVPGVRIAQPHTLHPCIAWDGTRGFMNGLGVFAERPDRRLEAGTILPFTIDRTSLVRLD